ncbi:MAG: hypothetical protein Ct9H300mP11_10210 [Chloroflexota bacterium]|nr:MAG: hypothetical protein Ct9H300mP11_10210 [Chloroflexota bacterium]
MLHLAAQQDSGLLAIYRTLPRAALVLGGILAGLEGAADSQTSSVGLTGLDLEQLSFRLGAPEKRRADPALSDLNEEKVASLLTKDGPFSKVFPGFEHRPEQEEMLASVTKAMYHNQHLVVEGGTGVGKSMSSLSSCCAFCNIQRTAGDRLYQHHQSERTVDE